MSYIKDKEDKLYLEVHHNEINSLSSLSPESNPSSSPSANSLTPLFIRKVLNCIFNPNIFSASLNKSDKYSFDRSFSLFNSMIT